MFLIFLSNYVIIGTVTDVTMNLVVTNNVPLAFVKSCTNPSSMSASVITISSNQVYAVNKWMMSTSGKFLSLFDKVFALD